MIPAATGEPNLEKIELKGVQETLLLTLYARALESSSPNPILRDETAERLVERLDYDFERLRPTCQDRFVVSVRAKQLDVWTREFLAAQPTSTVLHLGCGLDSRSLRVAPPSSVRWFDVDLPEVIEVRRRVYPELPAVHMLVASVADPEFLSEIPADRPTLVVAEGIFPYLSGADVEALLRRVVHRFPGGQAIFDAMSRRALYLQGLHPVLRRLGVQLIWGVDDPREIEARVVGLELMNEWPLIGSPDVAKLPWPRRALMRWCARSPELARMYRLLRFRY